jgi:hypothetical protein
MRVAGAIVVASIGVAMLAGPAAGSPPTGPSHCGPKAIRSTLVSFTAALDRGDLDALDPGVAGGDWLPVPGKGAAICHEGETRLIVMSFGRVGGV